MDVLVDLYIRSGRLLSFESFRNVLTGFPFFKRMVVLVIRLERLRIGLGRVRTLVAASETIVMVTESTHSVSPSGLIARARCHFSSS